VALDAEIQHDKSNPSIHEKKRNLERAKFLKKELHILKEEEGILQRLESGLQGLKNSENLPLLDGGQKKTEDFLRNVEDARVLLENMPSDSEKGEVTQLLSEHMDEMTNLISEELPKWMEFFHAFRLREGLKDIRWELAEVKAGIEVELLRQDKLNEELRKAEIDYEAKYAKYKTEKHDDELSAIRNGMSVLQANDDALASAIRGISVHSRTNSTTVRAGSDSTSVGPYVTDVRLSVPAVHLGSASTTASESQLTLEAKKRMEEAKDKVDYYTAELQKLVDFRKRESELCEAPRKLEERNAKALVDLKADVDKKTNGRHSLIQELQSKDWSMLKVPNREAVLGSLMEDLEFKPDGCAPCCGNPDTFAGESPFVLSEYGLLKETTRVIRERQDIRNERFVTHRSRLEKSHLTLGDVPTLVSSPKYAWTGVGLKEVKDTAGTKTVLRMPYENQLLSTLSEKMKTAASVFVSDKAASYGVGSDEEATLVREKQGSYRAHKHFPHLERTQVTLTHIPAHSLFVDSSELRVQQPIGSELAI
jgi:hypothetical protein